MHSLMWCAVPLVVLSATAYPQEPVTRPIQDNSFLLEEAYNQEAAVIQHISTLVFDRSRGNWVYALTDEWPVNEQRHQLSLTLPVQRAERIPAGFGEAALNYRLQLMGSGDTRLAVTPRATLLLPTGASRFGDAGVGFQGAIASSVQPVGWLVFHTNGGITLHPRAHTGAGTSTSRLGVSAGQSVIWLARRRFNVMLECVLVNEDEGDGSTRRVTSITLAPGIRWAHDFTSGLQIVPGVAWLVGMNASRGDRGALLYLSVEHELAALRP